MKTGLLLLTLLVWVGACHRDTGIDPSDPFYQRWRLIQFRTSPEAGWTSQPDTTSDVQFRPDGALIYRINGNVVDTPCCASSRFERDKTIIRYTDASICPNALCSSPSETNEAVITKLDSHALELTMSNWQAQFRSVQ